MEKYELGNSALEKVCGGSFYTNEYYASKSAVQFIFKVGDVVEVQNWFGIGTVSCRIVAVEAEEVSCGSTGVPGMAGSASMHHGWIDKYYCQEQESHWYFPNGWYTRDMLQMRTL